MQYTLWERIILANEITRQAKKRAMKARQYALQTQKEINEEADRIDADDPPCTEPK